MEYIFSVPKFTKKNKIENTVELMERLGRPERGMKIIHVAGTNGKGSVCAFLSEILEQAGKNVGLFTSPHLVKINERFQINNVPISDSAFLDAYREVHGAIEAMTKDGFAHPTYFELLFATAMVAFRNAKIEYAVLETGLGGRLDATNMVEHPLAVVLTSISLDHTEILGDTIEKIAWEKAGIIKPGVPVIYDGRNREAEKVIQKRARELSAPLYPLYQESYQILETGRDSLMFSLNWGSYHHELVKVPFPAIYQAVNGTLALMAVDVMDTEREIPVEKRIQAVKRTRWQGRMETVLPGIILDGAHNAAGVEEFIRTASRAEEEGPVVLLFSAVLEKNYETMIESICTGIQLRSIVVTEVGQDRKVSAGKLAEIFQKYTKAPVQAIPEVSLAFEEARKEKENGTLFCVGSLYLVGEIKRILEER